jgi:glycosyltransferase involved in cell wall biosynthesis
MIIQISVVIPLYNKIRHIRRAIDSVLAQKYSDFELIVVDDGSTDGSADVVRLIADPRIRLITQKNLGESGARNRGVFEAKADMVAFLDADDEWLPHFLVTMIDLRSRHPKAGMYASAYHICEKTKIRTPEYVDCPIELCGGLIEDYFRAGLGPPPITSSSVMIPKKILYEVGLFPLGVQRGGDQHCWVRIALRYHVAWSPAVCAIYHHSADNRACNIHFPYKDIAAAAAIEEFLQSGQEPISSRIIVKEYLVSQRLSTSLFFHLNGKRSWALHLLNKTRKTKLFKRKWLFLKLIFLLPPAVSDYAKKIKALVGKHFAK